MLLFLVALFRAWGIELSLDDCPEGAHLVHTHLRIANSLYYPAPPRPSAPARPIAAVRCRRHHAWSLPCPRRRRLTDASRPPPTSPPGTSSSCRCPGTPSFYKGPAMFQFRHEKGDKKGARDAAHSHYGGPLQKIWDLNNEIASSEVKIASKM
ncbi:uncharacterized protein LOC120674696 [Panicum virgatum]|uniref:uncharacterized protein LOC120674696 n=1 Tax=Panicum virgatum TaxID=38727 RepID=UPI0019D5311F|nr:uncharacterized protein LOC120674696 [Panicum virgatum]